MSNKNGIIALAVLALGFQSVANAKTISADILLGKICKATAALSFSKDPKIMKLDAIKGDIAYVHYIRSSDKSKWAIKCRLNGERVEWASNNPDSLGRWRTDADDSVITYSIDGDKLHIQEKYDDNSATSESYKLSSL
ncbi:hypothetical protein ACQ8YR_001299 [Yersinia enterocolitica]|uniref:Uncharacterized protein n=2 Tax=Yersinia TaxID=629 RepID=A0ABN4FDH8_9GAMM|nr:MULTISPECIES: hypothetical protein [Yersinia]AJI86853.1 putative enzyme [Yersinia frederiksenii Y225]AIN17610.1 putative enzyme [Yersinia rochesterensis]AJJ35409.1 hypothetical protein CH54_3047 [Yersinia rochesterensis]ATX62845.1 hypothetical protein LC20_07695 [Yersinia hibernica]EKN3443817.1 hypothetical protein [Yersinia enterocolitica]